MLHAMRTGDMKQEMGTGPGPLKVITDNSSRGLVWPPLGEEKLKSHPRSRPSADPGGGLWAVSPSLPDAQAGGGRLEPADAGLAGVRLKDDFTHLTPRGWYLAANLLCLFSPGRKTPLYQELERVRALTATQRSLGTTDAATGK